MIPHPSPATTTWWRSTPRCRLISRGKFAPIPLATSSTAALEGRWTFCAALRDPKVASPSSRFRQLPRRARFHGSFLLLLFEVEDVDPGKPRIGHDNASTRVGHHAVGADHLMVIGRA